MSERVSPSRCSSLQGPSFCVKLRAGFVSHENFTRLQRSQPLTIWPPAILPYPQSKKKAAKVIEHHKFIVDYTGPAENKIVRARR